MNLSERLTQMADDACFAVSDLLDNAAFERFNALSDLDKVRWRYAHADCDDFAQALHEITGWTIVTLTHPRRGPIHRLCRDEQGGLVDVYGWVTLHDLISRYHLRRGDVQTIAGTFCLLDEAGLCDVIRDIETLGAFGIFPFAAATFAQQCTKTLARLQSPIDEAPTEDWAILAPVTKPPI